MIFFATMLEVNMDELVITRGVPAYNCHGFIIDLLCECLSKWPVIAYVQSVRQTINQSNFTDL